MSIHLGLVAGATRPDEHLLIPPPLRPIGGPNQPVTDQGAVSALPPAFALYQGLPSLLTHRGRQA